MKYLKKKEIKRLTEKLNFNKQNESSFNSSDLEKVDLDYEIKIEANINTDDEEGDFEKKKKVRQIFRKLTDKKVNNYNNNNNINVNNNNMIDYNMKNMKYNYNRIKNEISDNINNVKIRGLNNPGRKSVNINFYNENFNIKEVGDFLQKENKYQNQIFYHYKKTQNIFSHQSNKIHHNHSLNYYSILQNKFYHQ